MMSDLDGQQRRIVSELSDIITGASLEPEHWQSFVDRFAELVPGSKTFLFVTDSKAQRAMPLIQSGFDETRMRAFAQYYGAMNGWTPFNLALPFLQVRRSEDWLPSSTFKETEFYRDFLRHLPESDAATAVKLSSDNSRFVELALHYGVKENERINSVAEPVMRALAPAMSQALAMLRVSVGTQNRLSLATLADEILDPAFVLSYTGRVLAANTGAQALVNEASFIRIAPGDRLRFLNPGAAAAVAEEIARIKRGEAVSAGQESIRAFPPDGLFSISIYPTAPGRGGGFSQLAPREPAVLLILRPLLGREAKASGVLRERFGLTAAEERLATGLARGASLSATAEALGISYQTGRSQLKAIFAKLNVHRQSELVALLLSFIAPL